jgi:hypothetical protein
MSDENTTDAPQAQTDGDQAGTADKALQQLQQDHASSVRTLEYIKEKIDSGDSLTAKDQKKLAAAQTRLSKVAEKLRAGNYDVVDDAPLTAEALVEAGAVIDQLRSDNIALRDDVKALANRMAWKDYARDYPNVDVKGLWTKAIQRAGEVIGDDNEEKLTRLATKYLDEMCESAKAGTEAAKSKPKPAPAAPISRVQIDAAHGQTAPPNEFERYQKLAMGLIPTD